MPGILRLSAAAFWNSEAEGTKLTTPARQSAGTWTEGKKVPMARFGCIADDFTGASDMASFLARGGMRTILYNGIPEPGTWRMERMQW